MPSTFERVVDGTIASVLARIVSSLLHPSQVVLNVFREPQQGVRNIQEIIDSDTNVVTLSLDLSKLRELTHGGFYTFSLYVGRLFGLCNTLSISCSIVVPNKKFKVSFYLPK